MRGGVKPITHYKFKEKKNSKKAKPDIKLIVEIPGIVSVYEHVCATKEYGKYTEWIRGELSPTEVEVMIAEFRITRALERLAYED